MKLIISACFILCISFSSLGQAYFNKVIDYQGGAEFARTVIPVDTGYFVIGFAQPVNQLYKLNINYIDINGNLTISKIYGQDSVHFSPGFAGSFQKHSGNGFIGAGHNQDLMSNDNFSFYRLDQNGDSSFFRSYGITGVDEIAWDVEEIRDNGYILAGYRGSHFNNTANAYIIRIDTFGNIIWDKSYGGAGNDIIANVKALKSKNFAVSGYKYNIDNYDPWLFVIDTSGAIIWQKFYGTKGDDSGISMELTQDNGFIISGYLDTFNTIFNNDNKAYYIAKLDSFGNIIWRKFLGSNTTHYDIWSIIETTGGDILYAGNREDNYSSLYGTVGKLDSTGNLLWERKFQFNNSPSNYLADLKPTTDGGIIAVGMTHNITQDVWVLKLDSMGCLTPGCDTVLNIIAPNIINTLEIYPNPTSDKFQIKLQLNYQRESCLEIYDLQGRLFFYKHIYGIVLDESIDVSDWAKGLYFIRLSVDGKTLKTEKVVIQ